MLRERGQMIQRAKYHLIPFVWCSFFFLSRSIVSNSLRPHGLYSPWNSPIQNTRMGSLSLLQGIFPTQGSNPGLPHCRRIILPAEPLREAQKYKMVILKHVLHFGFLWFFFSWLDSCCSFFLGGGAEESQNVVFLCRH